MSARTQMDRNLEPLWALRTTRRTSKAWRRSGSQRRQAGVYRLTVDAQGAFSGPVERKSLAGFLKGNSILKRFAEIPSKENGIDIEGLAADAGGKLFAGLRGPVLRGNFVPVLVFDFDHPEAATLRFVNLKGLGIRDMAAVKDGFLMLAGPVGEGPADFRIFFWDGADAIPGKPQPRREQGLRGENRLTARP